MATRRETGQGVTITFDLDKGLDHAMVTAASALDRHLERLTDESWLRMIASGLDEGYALDVLDQMREANALVRANALVEIRAMLTKEFPQ